jgi:hypothetical protein
MDDPTSLLFCRDGFRVVDVVRTHRAGHCHRAVVAATSTDARAGYR